jgi:hypothetical protein
LRTDRAQTAIRVVRWGLAALLVTVITGVVFAAGANLVRKATGPPSVRIVDAASTAIVVLSSDPRITMGLSLTISPDENWQLHPSAYPPENPPADLPQEVTALIVMPPGWSIDILEESESYGVRVTTLHSARPTWVEGTEDLQTIEVPFRRDPGGGYHFPGAIIRARPGSGASYDTGTGKRIIVPQIDATLSFRCDDVPEGAGVEFCPLSPTTLRVMDQGQGGWHGFDPSYRLDNKEQFRVYLTLHDDWRLSSSNPPPEGTTEVIVVHGLTGGEQYWSDVAFRGYLWECQPG